MARYTIDYFEIPSRAAPASSAFFSKAFGFAAQAFGDDYIEIREGGVLGGINSDPNDKVAAPVIGIRTDDIAAAAKAIVAAGGTITRQAYDFPGGKRMFFREPGGAELLVYQPSA